MTFFSNDEIRTTPFFCFACNLFRYSNDVKYLRDLKIHLTNYSIQKKSKNYKQNTDYNEYLFTKWSLKQLLEYLQIRDHQNIDLLLSDIHDIVIKTMLSVHASITSRLTLANCSWKQCFELYGFDILLTDELVPYLLEVNLLPSLSSSSPFDKRIKTTLMCDIFHCIGVEPVDMKEYSSLQSNSLESAHKRSPTCENFSKERLMIGPREVQLLQEIQDQLNRSGNFRCIYPLTSNVAKYQGFYGSATYNCLLWLNFLKLSPAEQSLILNVDNKGNDDILFQIVVSETAVTLKTASTPQN
ncbi:Tubulin-tyrosine ligase family protein [Reticulomyxa filosa]|uniref:Tubulin--tyrosine ligase-like protein 5 n=1 Tax=Reticulomyxa filosa TaxID=46433 RepID=X6MAT4_RETFI|nr:Tubulin-tyrosine ligase family protein [Reticulomyxa filosa]|eukprot:ETO10150.1 Tubulin-tyrosine ligase family protein [Reticulomyxa filosa]